MKKVVLILLVHITSILPQESPFKTYYPNGNIESEISYHDSVREGEAKFYYEDGTLKEERLYVNGRVEGLVKTYHLNGKLKELINIEDGKREGPTSVFDEEGNYIKDIPFKEGIQVVDKKNPYIIEEPETKLAQKDNEQTPLKNTPRRKKQNYELPPPQQTENLEDDPAIFRSVEVMPEPVGGMDAIKKKLIYPDEAKENGIEGIVEIRVNVDEYGEVTDAEIVKGIGYGCDESARIAVYYTKFKPGLQKGKPVKVQFVIPVEFKIFDRPGEN